MKSYASWNEFQWENEIKRHEYNAAALFQDLVYCLDLPIAYSDLNIIPGEQPPATVSSTQNDALKQWMLDHENDEEQSEVTQQDEYRHPVCFSCVDSLDHLAVMWNQFAVENFSGEAFHKAMGVTCAFGKLLARVADFTEPSKACENSLLITLGKRAVAELEELVDYLHEYHAEYFISRLSLLRDQLTDRLQELRNSTAE
jgi:hypothetical protein